MSGRFWCKIRVYKNRFRGLTFFSFDHFFAWNDVQLIGLPHFYLRFYFWKTKKLFDKIFKKYFAFKNCLVCRKKRDKCYRTDQDEPILKISSWYLKRWLTYTTFRSSVYRVWKNACNSNAYLSVLPTSHNKLKGTIGFLSCIRRMFFVDIYEIGNLTIFDLTLTWPSL